MRDKQHIIYFIDEKNVENQRKMMKKKEIERFIEI